MAMSDWMQSVTGRTNAEHQAWRDNYNGGWAAGDVTGNVNRAIAWERAASGEDNKEIRELLPAGLTPEMISGKTTSNANRGGSSAGGSGGQGASPSQSGKLTGGGNAPVTRRSTQSALPNVPAARLRAFANNTNPDLFGKLFARGSTEHPMDDLEKHGQVVINGVPIKHDKGWSPAMVIEDVYGELVAAGYGAVKMAADWNETMGLDRSLDAQRGPWYQLGQDITAATKRAYQDAETHWNKAVEWSAQNIPKGYESTPGNANPYSGNSPWSAPFN